MKTPGQAAYEKYVAPRKNVSLKWEQFPSETQKVWEEIAKAAINQHIDNRDAINQGYTPL